MKIVETELIMSGALDMMIFSLVTAYLIPTAVSECTTDIYDTSLCSYYQYNCNPIPQAEAYFLTVNQTTTKRQIKTLMPPNEMWYFIIVNGTGPVLSNPAINLNSSIHCEDSIWNLHYSDSNIILPFTRLLFSRTMPLNRPLGHPVGCADDANYDPTVCADFKYGCNVVPQTEAFIVINNDTIGTKQLAVLRAPTQVWYYILDDYYNRYIQDEIGGNNSFICLSNQWFYFNPRNKLPSPLLKWAYSRTKPTNTLPAGSCTLQYWDYNCYPEISCLEVDHNLGAKIIINDQGLEEIQFLTNDYVHFIANDSINNIFVELQKVAAQTMNGRTRCNNGSWSYTSPEVNVTSFNKIYIFTTDPSDPSTAGLTTTPCAWNGPYFITSPCDAIEGECYWVPYKMAFRSFINTTINRQQMEFLRDGDMLVVVTAGDDDGDLFIPAKEANGLIVCNEVGKYVYRRGSKNRTVDGFSVYSKVPVVPQCRVDNAYDVSLCDRYISNCNAIPQSEAFVVIWNETTGQQQVKVLSQPNELWYWITTDASGSTVVNPADNLNNSFYCDQGTWIINLWNVKYKLNKFVFSRTQPFNVTAPLGCSDDANYNPSLCTYPYGCDMVPQSEAFIIVTNETTQNKQLKILMPEDEVWYWFVHDESRLWLNRVYEMNNTFFCLNNMWYAYNQWNKVPSAVFAFAFSRRKPSKTPLPNLCQLQYVDSIQCAPGLLCTRLEQSKAVKVVMGSDDIQQLVFLTDSDVVQASFNSSQINFPTYSMNGKTKCYNGTWMYYAPTYTLSFTSLVVYTQSQCQSCPPKLNYDPTLCQQVLSSDSSVTNCNPVYDTNTLFTLSDNGPCTAQRVTFLTKTLKAAIFLENGTLFRASFPSDYLKSRVVCFGKWQYYDTFTERTITIGKLIMFKDEVPVTTLPPPTCWTCPADVNYNSTLCPLVRSSDSSVAFCNPIMDTKALFTINDNSDNGPCTEQTVTFLTASLKTAIFLEDGTLFRTPFASSYLKGNVFCTKGTWQFYDGATKKSINIGNLLMFTDDPPTTTLPPLSCSSCTPNVNYDSTICPFVKQVPRNPPVTVCNPVTDTTSLFKITDNGVCKEQTATFLTKTLSTAIFLPNGTIYNTIFASDALKGVVTCSRGKWYIYNKSTKTNYEIGRLIMFTEK